MVANGAEGEPATFKDRALMRHDPYRVIEGVAIAALAVGATEAYVATKRSFAREGEGLRRATLELGEAGLLGDLVVTLVEGPDEYLFGEEKALLEVIEGRDPLPRLLPPWQHGLFATAAAGGWESETAGVTARGDSNPTLVNNVETLASAAYVLARGADWFRSMGTAESPGTIITTVVGDVAHPGVHEVELGTPFREVLDRLRWRPDRAAAAGGVPGCLQPGAASRGLRRAPHLRGPGGTGIGAGSGWVRGLRRRGRPAARRPSSCRGSWPSSRVGSARPARAARCASPTVWPPSRRVVAAMNWARSMPSCAP